MGKIYEKNAPGYRFLHMEVEFSKGSSANNFHKRGNYDRIKE
jgi:hypothetical protein